MFTLRSSNDNLVGISSARNSDRFWTRSRNVPRSLASDITVKYNRRPSYTSIFPLFPPSASSFNQTISYFLQTCKYLLFSFFLFIFPFHFLITSERRWMGDCLNYYSDWYIFQLSYRFVVDFSSLFESELDSFLDAWIIRRRYFYLFLFSNVNEYNWHKWTFLRLFPSSFLCVLSYIIVLSFYRSF